MWISREPFSRLTSHLLDPAEGSEVTRGGRLLKQLMGREREKEEKEGETKSKAWTPLQCNSEKLDS